MKNFLWCLAFCLISANAYAEADISTGKEQDLLKRYMYVCPFTAGSKCSFSVPATNTKTIYFDSMVINGSAAASVTFERGGTPPTSTAGVVIPLNTTVSAGLLVWTAAATAGAGTSSVPLGPLVANTDMTYKIQMDTFYPKTAKCITVTPASGNGNVIVWWGEK